MAQKVQARGWDSPEAAFTALLEVVQQAGVPFTLHEHQATRTVQDAEENLWFDVQRLVKTVAFRTRNAETLLVALRGSRRAHYPSIAGILGLSRRDIAPLSPEEVRRLLGVEPGSVSPLLGALADATVLIDEDVLSISPTIYCGIGRPDMTIEMAAPDLVQLSRGKVGRLSR